MREINRYLCALLLTPLILLGCSEDADVAAVKDSEGFVSFGVSTTRAESGDFSDENSLLKIYRIDDNGDYGDNVFTLIRRYNPISDMPSEISLIEGDYLVTVALGDDTAATFENTLLSNYGEKQFSVVAGENESVEVDCKMINTVVRVEFENQSDEASTLDTNLKPGYSLTVMAANNFADEAVGSKMTPQLTYTESGVGYFILPDGVEDISWKFTGEKMYTADGGDSAVVMSGVISAPKATEQTTLKFSYPKYLEVSQSVSVLVDDSVDSKDDAYNFVPQPQISSEVLGTVQDIVGDVSYSIDVDSFLDIKGVVLTLDGGQNITLCDNGVPQSDSGASFDFLDGSTTKGVLTLNKTLFNSFTSGGQKSIDIKVTDSANIDGTAIFKCRVSGVISVYNLDLWSNTGSISAMILSGGDSATIQYREKGATDWIDCQNISSSDGTTYSAQIKPEWNSGKNDAGLDVYTLKSGVTSGNDYECRLVTTDAEYNSSFKTEASGTQLPDADFSNTSHACYSTSSSSSATWSSGNNTKSGGSSLCKSGTRSVDGVSNPYAKLEASEVTVIGITKFAAGNVFYGQFTMSTTTGTAAMGQVFSWKARPRKLKFDYAATVGKVEYTGQGFDSDDYDEGRVYLAIVNWSSRREVESGLSTSGVWEPTTQTSVDGCGKIIGYASMFITKDECTPNMSTFVEKELDIYYYDKTTIPTTNNISVIVSCSTSRYGDYLVGSPDSKLYVDDFELIY